ncbi:MAG TPA: hypothetical protein VJU78_09600, partial [Chitinophagaceae bacterium]|nr:hypothetical protein [Chitinophagaceae bacterium]
MKRKLFMAVMLCLFMMSCRKDKISIPNEPGDSGETITPVGTPIGQAVHKIIDANGGQLASADGTLKLIIPAGALTTATDITIQPISNELTGGIGNAYRLTPHGQIFSKPVTITFNYKVTDTTDSRPEFLDIAFQDAEGSWQMLTNTTVDKVQKKLSATTTHFSDWGYFKSIQINPGEATVDQGAFMELKVTTTFPRIDPDDAAPGTYTIKVLKKPRKLRDDEIKGWNYAGEGKLDPEGSSAFYTAPDHEPGINPEAIVANINMHRKGQFMVFSNITVLGNSAVDYLWVDEDFLKAGMNGNSLLYIYGNFGNDPGTNKRSVKINGVSVTADLWSPKIIRCRIDQEIFGPVEIAANGHVVARTVLRKFKGKFIYERFHGGLLNAGSSNALKETTEFTLVFRGFGKPCPANVDLLFPKEGALAEGTEASYTLGGSASVSTPLVDGCVNTTSVSLPATSGFYSLRPHSMPTQPGHSTFKAEANDIEGGIEVTITDYQMENVITGVQVKRSSSCGPSSLDPAKPLGVGLEGFQNEVIRLEYWGTDELKLKGTNKLTSYRMSSSILI